MSPEPRRRRTAARVRRPRTAAHWAEALAIAAVMVALCGAARLHSFGGDAWGALLTAQSILEHRTIRLDAYPAATRDYQFHDLGGHRYYFQPLGTSILALPYVAVARALGADMSSRADDAVAQRHLATAAVAATAALMLILCRLFLRPPAAWVVAAAFAFGSMVTSSMAKGLCNFDLSVPLLLAALILVARHALGHAKTLRGGALGALLFAAYLCRPSAAALAACVGVYVLLRAREALRALVLAAAAPMAALVAFSLHEFGSVLPTYYLGSGIQAGGLSWRSLYGCLLSPGRGLLVYCPYLLVTIAGALLAARHVARRPLFWVAVVPVVAQTLVTASYFLWWGGWSYGSRLFSDALPPLLLATLVVLDALPLVAGPTARAVFASCFGVLTAAAIFIHSVQGLFNPATERWNALPDVDTHPDILFDWRHPQFLASDEGIAERARERRR